jgi:hypothetical protein
MSNEPRVVDPSAGTGTAPPRWPNPADHPHPAPLVARESRRKMLLGALVFLPVGVLALSQVNEISFAYIGRLVFGCLLALLGGFCLWGALRAKSASRVMVSMDTRGLAMPFWFEKAVPWSEIEDVVYRSPWTLGRRFNPPLRITIRDPGRFGPTWHARLAAENSMPVFLGNNHDVSAKTLFETMQAFRAHFGRGGKPA